MKIERKGEIIHITRICGGISWPTDKAGCACMVGEDGDYDYDLEAYPIYLLDEIVSKDNEELIQWASERKVAHDIDSFVGLRSPNNIRFLSLWNKNERPMGSPRFHVKQAPMSQTDSLEYHLKVINSRTKKDRKTLHLMPNSLIKMQLLDVGSVSKATAEELPSVAAFAYAVCTLNLYQRDTKGEIMYRRSWARGQII